MPGLSKFICSVGLFSVACLSAAPTAAQWPVHGAPTNGAVPQYRPGRYPLLEQAAPQSATPVQSKVATPAMTSTPPIAPAVQAKPDLPLAPPAVKRIPAPVKTQPMASASGKKPKPNPKKATPAKPIVDYKIYRDRNPLPIDPRKPCEVCTTRGCSHCDTPGVGGRPYRETEPGGCRCGDKKCGHKPDFSLYWPRPFSAKLDEHFPDRANERYSTCPQKRIVDVFDPLSTFKLSQYKRSDNGYCGPGSDPFGCLGESRQLQQSSRVAGVGYRFPSEPVQRP